jgi:LacI family transcriptional regulator
MSRTTPPIPTLKQIATKAGVSTYTVSIALNGDPKAGRISPDRVKAVRKIARQMGYRANAAAVAMRTGRRGCIGMVTSTEFSFSVHVPDFERGVVTELARRGLYLAKDHLVEAAGGAAVSLPRLVTESIADGLLINYAFNIPAQMEKLLRQHATPAIWINSKHTVNCVRPDDEAGGIVAARVLLEHGHRRIVWIDPSATRPQDTAEAHYSAADRQAGYARAMTEAGLKPWIIDRGRIGSTDEAYRGHMLRRLLALLDGPDRPTALITNGGGRAAMLAAARLGLRVPADVSIIAFDDIGYHDNEIAFTRLLIPFEDIGVEAVREVCALMASPGERDPRLVPLVFQNVGTVGKCATD